MHLPTIFTFVLFVSAVRVNALPYPSSPGPSKGHGHHSPLPPHSPTAEHHGTRHDLSRLKDFRLIREALERCIKQVDEWANQDPNAYHKAAKEISYDKCRENAAASLRDKEGVEPTDEPTPPESPRSSPSISPAPSTPSEGGYTGHGAPPFVDYGPYLPDPSQPGSRSRSPPRSPPRARPRFPPRSRSRSPAGSRSRNGHRG